ncbi:MAG: putative sugar nucleotidyl transferase [Bacteroidota bacterium]
MQLCLFEDEHVGHLAPLVLTRPVYHLRLGVRSVARRHHDVFAPAAMLFHMRQAVRPSVKQRTFGRGTLFVNGRYVPEPGPLAERLKAAAQPGEPSQVFMQDDTVIAAWVPDRTITLAADALPSSAFAELPSEPVEGARLLTRLWDVLDDLRGTLRDDIAACGPPDSLGQAAVHPNAIVVNPEAVFCGRDVTVKPGAILNAEAGPIYLDEGVTVHESAILRGPIYLGPNSQAKAQANLEGIATGPYCKVGGEVHGVIMQGYSNKGHAGFLGDSFLGEWCNLGADTNTSNLKNDYGIVSLYNEVSGGYEASGKQFLGLFMGDHSKCGINTMFNTGTVVGVSCNLYGAGLPPRYVPSFSWGGADGLVPYRLDKALRVAEAVMARRKRRLTPNDRAILTQLAEQAYASAG